MFFLKKCLGRLGLIIMLLVLILSFEEISSGNYSYAMEFEIIRGEEKVVFDPMKFHSFKGFKKDREEKKKNMFSSQAFNPIIYLGYSLIGLGLILEEMELRR